MSFLCYIWIYVLIGIIYSKVWPGGSKKGWAKEKKGANREGMWTRRVCEPLQTSVRIERVCEPLWTSVQIGRVCEPLWTGVWIGRIFESSLIGVRTYEVCEGKPG